MPEKKKYRANVVLGRQLVCTVNVAAYDEEHAKREAEAWLAFNRPKWNFDSIAVTALH